MRELEGKQEQRSKELWDFSGRVAGRLGQDRKDTWGFCS